MLVKKGFWVVLILLLALNVSAFQFSWKLTQNLEGIISHNCHNGFKTIEKMPIATEIEASFSNWYCGKTEKYIYVAGQIAKGGTIIWDGNRWGKDNDCDQYTTGTFQGEADEIRACNDGSGDGSYHIYIPSPLRQLNITRADGMVIVGPASDYAFPKFYDTARLIVESQDPRGKIWIDDSKIIYACLDYDKDTNCDYLQAQACQAYSGADWNGIWYNRTNGLFYESHCCGAEDYTATPCAYYPALNAVCGKNAQNEWKWISAGNIGQARPLSCPTPISFLISKNYEFFACGNMTSVSTTLSGNMQYQTYPSQNKLMVETRESVAHEFLCIPNEAKIIECTENGDVLNDGNLYKEAGDWINQTGIQFCTGNRWVTDLDEWNNKKACIAARQKNTWTGIAWTGIAWTGSKCCGDPADDNTPEGTYEDKWQEGREGTAGGCINNTFIASGEFADAAEKIINYKGEFYSCGQSKTLGTITTKAQPTCGTPLLNATLIGTKHHIVCTPEAKWMFTNNTASTQATSTTWSTSKGCCLSTQCWDGENCKEIGKTITIEDRGYRCAPN